MSTSVFAQDAEQVVDEALGLLKSIEEGDWDKAGASGLGLLDATMRPIDDLTRDGVGWLHPYVQDLQAVLDRLAGNAAVIQHYAAAWQRRAAKVEQIRFQLEDRVKNQTGEWNGDAAEVYRQRAEELNHALDAAAAASKTNAAIATVVGAAVGKARGEARDQLAELVKQLTQYVKMATGAQQGLTTDVLEKCTEMIASYRPGIFGIETQLLQSLEQGVQPGEASPSTPPGQGVDTGALVEAGMNGFGVLASKNKKMWGQVQAIFSRRGLARIRKEVDRVWRQREREKERQEKKDWSSYKRKNYRGSEYADKLAEIYGPPPNDGKMYQAHHNFPVKFGEKFERMGIKTDNAAWGTWLEEGFHGNMSKKFEADWAKFFADHPNPTLADRPAAFKYVRELANAHKYTIPF